MDAAIHMADGVTWNDPVALFGTWVQLPKQITLKDWDGWVRTSAWYVAADTGGNDFPEHGWLDIYVGDRYQGASYYNSYWYENLNTVTSNFGSSPSNSARFTLYYNVP